MALDLIIKMIVSKTDHAQRLTKQRSDLELPKISKQPSFETLSYQLRYEWVNRSSEYLLLSNQEVEDEHDYLLNELSSLQQQNKKLMDSSSRVVTRPLHRSRQVNLSQNRQRSIENNNYILWKLRNECDQLQRQASPSSKEGTDVRILEARQKITKAKQKIKQLKLKSKVIGDSLENGHDYFQQFQKLERERQGHFSRKLKLEQKVRSNTSRLEKLFEKLSDIEGDVLYAETYLEQCQQNQKNESVEKTLESEHRQKSYQIDILRKTIESHRQTRQQKYHLLLKNYEMEAEKMEQLNQRMQSTQIRNLYQKKEILELEQTLSELQMLAQERSQTTGSVEPKIDVPDSRTQVTDHKAKSRSKVLVPRPQPKFNRINESKERKRQISSRSRTTGNYQEAKVNQTQMLIKPLSETDSITMITQPVVVNRGYFRSNRRIMDGMVERTARTALEGGQKSVDFIPVQISEEIQEQSPQKQTIRGNTIEASKERDEKTVEKIVTEPNDIEESHIEERMRSIEPQDPVVEEKQASPKLIEPSEQNEEGEEDLLQSAQKCEVGSDKKETAEGIPEEVQRQEE